MTRYIKEQINMCTVYQGVEVEGQMIEDGSYRFGNAAEILALIGLTRGRYGWDFNSIMGSVLFYEKDNYDSFGYAKIGDFILMDVKDNYLVVVRPEVMEVRYKVIDNADGKEEVQWQGST